MASCVEIKRLVGGVAGRKVNSATVTRLNERENTLGRFSPSSGDKKERAGMPRLGSGRPCREGALGPLSTLFGRVFDAGKSAAARRSSRLSSKRDIATRKHDISAWLSMAVKSLGLMEQVGEVLPLLRRRDSL